MEVCTVKCRQRWESTFSPVKLGRVSLGWGCAEGLGEVWLILTQCCVDRPWKVSVEPGGGKPEVKGPGP